MKKTRFFFTVTTFCIAIAAVTATKANGKITEIGYTNSPGNKCTVSSGIVCGNQGTGCVNAGGTQLFRFNGSSACSIALAKP
ncbi:hypothetical protein A4H97_22790 [Niastella yeongjuensis]|uniref:Uncharacterized protein n=1 Tax=Niastella yeongjuensis TaxID=354355 RepID=A0A1V9F7H3_9BACT|nr:hypothetical protein [Niastella yeongjuensis]OQP54314.1 hypothetical protein A4H97_22790 [Niastella yeongjuensis]SEP30389.1 hypothetical protein SAMN05660816_05152 [Niastella yeongjuensis]